MRGIGPRNTLDWVLAIARKPYALLRSTTAKRRCGCQESVGVMSETGTDVGNGRGDALARTSRVPVSYYIDSNQLLTP
jgi:hypothetical protein